MIRKNNQLRSVEYTSGYSGVSLHKRLNKYVSNIHIDGKNYYLGIFDNENEANEYYLKAIENHKVGKNIKIKKPDFSSKYKGVAFCKQTKKWKSYIYVDGKTKNIGRFNSQIEAYNKTLQPC